MRRSVWLVVALVALALPVSAQAAFPGQNGKIAFSDTSDDPNGEIYTINPDGTGIARLTNNAGPDVRPAWSPDGQRIVFNRYPVGPGTVQMVVMNADGSGQTPIGAGYDPSWSPDGSRIVFASTTEECLQTINPDGTGQAFLGCGPSGFGEHGEGDPVWSPDGALIAFTADLLNFDIFTLGSDGTNRTNLTNSNDDIDAHANWSPDAAKLVWDSDDITDPGVWIMNRDGSGKTPLLPGANPAFSPDGTKLVVDGLTIYNADGSFSAFSISGVEPDWQPIPINTYARPKGATPFRVSLAIAYESCSAPDRTHGPPLAFPSCNPPQQTSDHLTVGTADANAQPALNEGSVRFDVQAGVPGGPDDADVDVQVFMDDVFTKPGLADYTGELAARVSLQITDKDSAPHPGGPAAATTTSIPLTATATCTASVAANEGASCTAATSLDALVPGIVKEGRRSIWQLGRVELYDGGADGDAQTPAGDTLLATQGLFIP